MRAVEVYELGFGDVDPVAIAQAAGQQAGAGSAFGPYGAIIGGAIGAGSSLVSQLTQQPTPPKPAVPTASGGAMSPAKLPPIDLVASINRERGVVGGAQRGGNASTLPFGLSPMALAVGGGLVLAFLASRKRGA